MTTGVRVTLGGAKPPRSHGEAAHARRTAIVAFAFFLAAALHLAVEGVGIASLQQAFPLYALGGFGILIFGTARLLLAGMAGRDVAGGARSALVVVGLAAVGAAGLYLAADARRALAVAAALAWGIAALGHVIVMLVTARRRAVRPAVVDENAAPGTRPPVRALEAGSLAYAAASALALPLAFAGALSVAAALHVVLVGFVIVTIMAVALHILPRFTHARVPAPLAWALAPLALAGPALMAAGLGGWRAALAPGAAVEGLAFALFGVIVASLFARSRRLRPHHAAYLGAPIAVGVGGLLALAFAWRGAFAGQLAVHGLLNVFGFAGLMVFAASTDLYAPALEAGAAPAKRHAAVAALSALAGLVVAAAGAWMGRDLWARAGMAAYAAAVAWQLAGIVAAHRRAGRVVARFGGA